MASAIVASPKLWWRRGPPCKALHAGATGRQLDEPLGASGIVESRRIAWVVSAVLAALALGLGLVPWAAIREPLRLGAAVALLALALGAAGVGIALSLRRPWLRAGAAITTGLVVVFAGWAALVFASVPQLPFTVIEWKRVADDANATVVDASLVPKDALAAMRSAPIGGTGCAYFASEADWNAFAVRFAAAGGDTTYHLTTATLNVDGRAIIFGRAEGAPGCPIP